MSLLSLLPEIMEESRTIFEHFMNYETDAGADFVKEAEFSDVIVNCISRQNDSANHTASAPQTLSNIIAHGDNIDFMKYLVKEKNMSGKIQMIYIDPPFFSEAKYEAVLDVGSSKVKQFAYNDVWESGIAEYLKMFCVRAFFMRELLAEEGAIWVHLDWHAVHYVKMLMDEIFGKENFINEIIWTYKSGGSTNRSFARKHDNILFYGKSKNYYFVPKKEKSYNRGLRPYRFKNIREFKDDIGWYTMVNRKDVWHIDMVGRTSKERTGYATQKPAALIEKMIEACSRQGDICADFFAGSGVVAKTALDMNRNFVSCDVGPLSCGKQMSGIINAGGCFELLCERANCPNNPERSFSAKINIRRNCGSLIADVEIIGYTLDVDALSLNNADRAVVREACWHDLIEKWSVDFRYNGTYHNPELVFIRTGKELKFKASQTFNPSENYRINIMVNDVFGYRLFREFELSEGEK